METNWNNEGKNNHENLVNACNECNLLKADMLLPRFIALLEKQKTDDPNDIFVIMIKNAKKLLNNG